MENPNQNLIDQIEDFLEISEKMKKAFFWTPPTIANMRRSYEKKYYRFIVESFTISYMKYNKKIEVEINLVAENLIKCSCKNIYRSVLVKINDVTTNIVSLKSILKYLQSGIINKSFIKKFSKKVE